MRWIVLAALVAGPALAQPALDDTVALGTVATLAPLCGLRAEAWSFDLRRAALQKATGTPRHDDAGLEAAPGRDTAESALGFAEAEALESFAEAPPAATCEPLAHSADLLRADRVVEAFRAQRTGS